MAQQRASVAPDSTSLTLRDNVFGSGFGTNTQSTNLFAGQSNQTFRLFEASSGQSGTTVSLAPSSPGTSSNLFGGNFAFASTAPVGQSGQPATFATNTNSQLFSSSGSQTATNPFLTNQSSMLFTESNEPSALLQTGSTTSVPLSTGHFSFTPSVFSMNQRQQTGVNNANFDVPSSPSSFSTPPPNIFGSFSGNNPFGSSNFTGSIASGPGVGSVLSSSTGIRKRDSSGAVSDNSLFGKPEKRSNQSEVYTGSTTIATPMFALTQSHDVQPSPRTPLFSNNVSSTTHTATFPSSSAFLGFQQRDAVSFNEKSSDSSRVENVGKGKVLFGKSQSEINVRASAPVQNVGLTFQSGLSCFTENNRSDNQISSLQPSTVPTVSKSNENFSGFVTNALLFRDPKNSDSSLSQEDSSSSLFKRPVDKSSDQGQVTLFGKPAQTRAALFGKLLPSSSSETFDRDRTSESHDVSGKYIYLWNKVYFCFHF